MTPTSGAYNQQTAVYESLKNTLAYHANGATSGSAPSGGMYDDETKIAVSDAGNLLKDGCRFVGWNTAADGSGTAYAPNAEFSITSSVTLYAQWEGEKYPITLNLNGGSDIEHEYGIVTTLPIPTKTGYDFGGWYTNFGFTGDAITEIGATETVMPTLFAKYKAKKITISFNLNGGTSANSENIQVDFDSPFTALPIATRAGYVFTGWFTEIDGGEKISINDINKFSEDTTLYAQWEGEKYPITLNLNGGSIAGGSDIKHEYGIVTTLPIPTKIGYEFGGWYVNSGFTGDAITEIGATETEMPTLYAQWEVVKKDIILSLGGGSLADGSSIKHEYGKVTTLPIPTKPGYEFGGWYTNSGFTGDAITEIGADVLDIPQLYAKWTVASVPGGDVNNGNVGLIICLILVGLLILLLIIYLCGYFFLYRKHKLDDKKIRVIYSFLPKAHDETIDTENKNQK